MTSALPNDTHHEDRNMNLNLKVRHIVAALTIAAAGTASANVTLYERDNFGGREINVNQSVANLAGTNFNDRARSAIVDSGRWEVCVDANFNGGCQVLGPGRYPDLGGLDGRVSSVRPVAEPVAAYRGNDGNRQRQATAAARARRCMKAAICPAARTRSAIGPWPISTERASTTARRRCTSTAATGSSAATRTSPATAARSAPATTRACRSDSTT
jgi:hypothetical protein